MNHVRTEGFQESLNFLEVGRHLLTLTLVLVCNLTNNELRITVDLKESFHLHFFGEVKSCYQCFILSFVVEGFEPKSKRAMHPMSFSADKY